MAKFHFTKKAVNDLTNIWEYTVIKWSANQAEIYYHLFLENCKEIAINPSICRNYELVDPDIFGLRVGRHIIFYKLIEGDSVEIIRILHGSMDLKNRLHEK